jgi:subtilisin family serine protease
MPRYVLANRRADKFTTDAKLYSRSAADTAWDRLLAVHSNVLGDSRPEDETRRRVVIFDADPDQIQETRKQLPPDVMLEPEIAHFPGMLGSASPPAGTGNTGLTVQVIGSDRPLEGTAVTLVLQGAQGMQQRVQTTQANGTSIFLYDTSVLSVAALMVLPSSPYWSMLTTATGTKAVVACPPLPSPLTNLWWQDCVGAGARDPNRGAGIRIGVADTGVGPHPSLAAIKDLGAYLDGDFVPGGGADEESHGSHVCGVIGARPVSECDLAGIAPGAHVMSLRVFAPVVGANQGDVANAIDSLSKDHLADLINLSLVATQPSEIEHDAIKDAYQRGTVCLCAAGNTAGSVSWPALFPESVAVSALGQPGWGPDGSLALAMNPPVGSDKRGADNYFLAAFSCFGSQLTCIAPGVGIISTVPAHGRWNAPVAELSGTSCATPIVCAVLAALLSRDEPYLKLPRNQQRADHARQVLITSCRTAGLKQMYQGYGMPCLK